MATLTTHSRAQHPVLVEADGARLHGDLSIPERATGVVLFAHGSGSSRHSPRNRLVAERLQQANLATLLLDLLTEQEEQVDRYTARHRFNVSLLAERLLAATDWLAEQRATVALPTGYFGASTGAAAALIAAAQRPNQIAAVVSRGGRPDLADQALPAVRAATLLIVGGNDEIVLELNERALIDLGSEDKELAVVPGASHLFEEPGKLEEVAALAIDWFRHHLWFRAECNGKGGAA